MISHRKAEKSIFEGELSNIYDRHTDDMKTEAKNLILHMVVQGELERINDFLTFEILRTKYFSAIKRKVIKRFIKYN